MKGSLTGKKKQFQAIAFSITMKTIDFDMGTYQITRMF